MDEIMRRLQALEERLIRVEQAEAAALAGHHNVLLYGARGDGLAADHVAIQAACDAARPNGVVYFPPPAKSYRVEAPIVVPPGVRLLGATRSTTIDAYVPPGEFVVVFQNTTHQAGGGLENLHLAVNTAGSHGIKAYQCWHLVLRNFSIDGNKDRNCAIGLFMDGGETGTAWCTVESFLINRCADAAVRLDTTVFDKSWCNRNFIRSGQLQSSAIGIDFVKANTNFVLGVGTQGCDIGMRLQPSARFNFIDNMDENSQAHSIVIAKGANRNRITGSFDTTKIVDESSATTWMLLPYTQVPSLRIGARGDAAITKHLSATKAWVSTPIAHGTAVSTTVKVPGADLGDTAVVGFDALTTPGWLMSGHVTARAEVTVTVLNLTGQDVALPDGTVRVDVWGHAEPEQAAVKAGRE